MAAKTLNEAIEKALCVGPASEFKERLVGELRDFLAHEIMKMDLQDKHLHPLAKDLFERVFKDIPPFKS